MTENDTETLLAVLSSILPEPIPAQEILLDALVQSNGDVNTAARKLSSDTNAGLKSKKRKRTTNLDAWLAHSIPLPSKSRSKSPEKKSSLKPMASGTSARDTMMAGPSRAGPSSTTKPIVNLMDVLRPPPSTGPSIPRYPPLTLNNPSMIAEHTPCTLHPSILPPELACELFYTMLNEARDWKRNKWWLFERLVESPHRTAIFVRSYDGADEQTRACLQAARLWYNGREADVPKVFPAPMERACTIIERVVNAEVLKRRRFPLEWGGLPPNAEGEKITWRANFAASNCYEGTKEAVGFHSDRLTSLGPYPTIASLSLGTPRVFRLREVIPVDEIDERATRTYNIPLPHNSLIIMHASAQERFKHSIPPQTTLDRFRPAFPPPASISSLTLDPTNCRINITFRFYRPDFHPDSLPKCRCGLPMALRPDMKKRQREGGDGKDIEEARGEGEFRYWWTCTGGEQNEGKGCGFWKVMDVKAEGRGPFVMDLS
ncbi:hypothetical protein EW146_g972 [Bondarzewia mesenterica]|uniref:Fe2OG dioxygenase domain-containing protein n=1 Tax=Bondarzewia mesenterica TaxID=1095465 RepID=A0A4S4M755_9AGAM|nr:hypothetical protein EW146_g972 [Bondarzewia mesenterica]